MFNDRKTLDSPLIRDYQVAAARPLEELGRLGIRQAEHWGPGRAPAGARRKEQEAACARAVAADGPGLDAAGAAAAAVGAAGPVGAELGMVDWEMRWGVAAGYLGAGTVAANNPRPVDFAVAVAVVVAAAVAVVDLESSMGGRSAEHSVVASLVAGNRTQMFPALAGGHMW